jgi:predicted  nucleic acid-binding Zn-ribbon protein
MTTEKIAEYRTNLVNQKNALNTEVQRIQAALEQTKNNAIATDGAIQALDNLVREEQAANEAAAKAVEPPPTEAKAEPAAK